MRIKRLNYALRFILFAGLTVFVLIASTTRADQALTQKTGVYEGTWEIRSRSGKIKFSLSVQADGTLTGELIDITGEQHAVSKSIVGEIQGSAIKIDDLASHSLDGTLIEGRITGDFCGRKCGSLDVRKVAD